MKLNLVWKLNLEELIALRNEVDTICKNYAETLTTYATVSNDPQFQKMEPEMEKSYQRRNEFAKLLSLLNHSIEEKIYEKYIKD